MAINRVKKRGKTRIEVRKQWPDATTYRRYFPNVTMAKATLTRIEGAVLDGTWRDLKVILQQGDLPEEESCPTIREFSEIYLREYCSIYNRRPDFKEQALNVINGILGDVLVKDIRRSDADHFVSVRVKDVAPATVNRGPGRIEEHAHFCGEKGCHRQEPLAGLWQAPCGRGTASDPDS